MDVAYNIRHAIWCGQPSVDFVFLLELATGGICYTVTRAGDLLDILSAAPRAMDFSTGVRSYLWENWMPSVARNLRADSCWDWFRWVFGMHLVQESSHRT